MINSIYRCEICGAESSNPVRWIVIHCSETQLIIHKCGAQFGITTCTQSL